MGLKARFGYLLLMAFIGGCATGTDALNGISQSSNTGTQDEQTGAALTSEAKLQLAPVIGVPEDAVTPLDARLRQRAAQRGITIVEEDGAATYFMKGYFSAFTESGETTVIYVWDVLDASGTRLHRIQGQRKLPADNAEGWDSVSAAGMEAIADESINQLVGWLSQRQA